MRRLSVPGFLCLLLAPDARAGEFACAGFQPTAAPAASVAAKPLPSVRVPESRGQHHAIVLFAKFKGEAPEITTAPEYAEALFDPNLRGSLSHFFGTMSSGQMELSATVLPKRYSSRRSADFYVSQVSGEPGKFSEFAIEILRAADGDVDFSDFDNDGPDGVPNSGDDDGNADYVFINVLSTPRGFIKGGATGVAGLRFDQPFQSNDMAARGGPHLLDSRTAGLRWTP